MAQGEIDAGQGKVPGSGDPGHLHVRRGLLQPHLCGGIDYNRDGKIDLDLWSLGARPDSHSSVLLFQPSAAEVHWKAGTWFQDREIYHWFALNLHRVREPSLRRYVRARELKAAGMDWTEILAEEAENPPARLAAELLASAAYGSTAARVKAFVEQGGGCRARFFNYRRKLGGSNRTGKGPSS